MSVFPRRPVRLAPGIAVVEGIGVLVIGILGCGLPLATATSSHPVLRSYDPPTGADAYPLRHMTDILLPTLQRGSTVCAIIPAWDDEPLYAHLLSVRSALESIRLVVHRTTLPPLAAGAFAHVVAELVRRELLEPGVLLGQLAAIERHVVAAAWLATVARTEEPATSLGLHARSYVPGSSFVAIVDDDPRITPLKRKAETMELPRSPLKSAWSIAMAAGPKGKVDLVKRSIVEHTWGATTTTVPLTETSSRWWGTDKLVELALVPEDLEVLAAAVLDGRSPAPCGWCGEAVLAEACPYCRDHVARRGDPGVAEPQPSPAPGGPA